MSTDLETCAWCPRLCRHVCPVAVGTGRESATPTAMMTVALQARRGEVSTELAAEAASLCLSCGACTAHCKLHVPVAERLGRPAPPRPAAPPASADGALVFAVCGSEGPVGAHQLACCGRNGGFDAREPEAARQVAEENVRRLDGRRVVCADAACAEWLRRHGADVVEPRRADVP